MSPKALGEINSSLPTVSLVRCKVSFHRDWQLQLPLLMLLFRSTAAWHHASCAVLVVPCSDERRSEQGFGKLDSVKTKIENLGTFWFGYILCCFLILLRIKLGIWEFEQVLSNFRPVSVLRVNSKESMHVPSSGLVYPWRTREIQVCFKGKVKALKVRMTKLMWNASSLTSWAIEERHSVRLIPYAEAKQKGKSPMWYPATKEKIQEIVTTVPSWFASDMPLRFLTTELWELTMQPHTLSLSLRASSNRYLLLYSSRLGGSFEPPVGMEWTKILDRISTMTFRVESKRTMREIPNLINYVTVVAGISIMDREYFGQRGGFINPSRQNWIGWFHSKKRRTRAALPQYFFARGFSDRQEGAGRVPLVAIIWWQDKMGNNSSFSLLWKW